MFSTLRSSCLYRQHSRTLKRICSDLQYWPVFIQSRGFKTLKSRTRRLQSTSERLAETQHTAPSFVKVIRPFSLLFDKAVLFRKNVQYRMYIFGQLIFFHLFIQDDGLIFYAIIISTTFWIPSCFSTSLLDIFLCFFLSVYTCLCILMLISSIHPGQKHCG